MMENSYRKLILCCFLFSFLGIASAQDYLWPTDASNALTSTFAESRPGRFHAGIDIKTWGKEGYKIVAIRPGHISRIRVSPYGYGRALYLTLDSGEIVVYAHLKRFNDEISRYVWQQQQNKGKYSVQLWPRSDLFRYEQGDVIGYTGQTGIGYPHLHFEIRDKANQPFNPLLLGYEVRDTISPVIRKVSLTPLNAHAHVDNDWQPVIVNPVYIKAGHYRLQDTLEVKGDIAFGVSAYDQMNGIHNKFGAYTVELRIDNQVVFSSRYDKFSYSVNGMAKLDRDYRLAALGHGYFYKLFRDLGNELPFYDGDRVYHGVVRFDDQNDPQPPGMQEFDIIRISGTHHKVEILVSDFWNNESVVTARLRVAELDKGDSDSLALARARDEELTFELYPTFYDTFVRIEIIASQELRGTPVVTGWYGNGLCRNVVLVRKDARSFYGVWNLENETTGPTPLQLKYINAAGQQVYQKKWLTFRTVPFGKKETLRTEDNHCQLVFHPNSFYRTVYVRSESVPIADEAQYDYAGKIYALNPLDVPMNGGVDLYLTYSAKDSLPSRLAIYKRNSRRQWRFVGNRLLKESNQIRSRIRTFGEYCLLRDSDPPRIDYLYPGRGQYIEDKTPTLKATFRDKLSGISGEANMVMWLDGKRLITEYDPDKRSLSYRVRTPLSTGSHRLMLLLRDRSGNTSRLSHDFHVK